MRLRLRDIIAIVITLVVFVGGTLFALLEQSQALIASAQAPTEMSLVMLNDKVDYGTEVILSANVSGVRGNYTLQWEYNDGNGWHVIEGAGDSEYSYVFSPENEFFSYRVYLKVRN